MAKKHLDGHADHLARSLYQRFLNRNPDPDGYRYVSESLREGRKSVRQHIVEIIGSEEFLIKFVRHKSRESVVQHLHTVLLGRKVTDRYQLGRQAADLMLLDVVPYAERLTHSPDYRNLYGEDDLPGVPRAAVA
jgi:predicted component of type VI protein secretion system